MSTWGLARNAYIIANEAEETYDRTTWRPAYYVAENGGPKIRADVDAEMERLTTVRIDAEDAVIYNLADDLAGVIWKIEHARESRKGFEDWPAGWWAAVMADLYRLERGS